MCTYTTGGRRSLTGLVIRVADRSGGPATRVSSPPSASAAAAGMSRPDCVGRRSACTHRKATGEPLGIEAVWHVDHHAVEGESEVLRRGSGGSGQLDATDGRGLRGAVGPLAERAPVEAVLGAPPGERLFRGGPVGRQFGASVLMMRRRGAGTVTSGRQGCAMLVTDWSPKSIRFGRHLPVPAAVGEVGVSLPSSAVFDRRGSRGRWARQRTSRPTPARHPSCSMRGRDGS
jgi:hypothetical protein